MGDRRRRNLLTQRFLSPVITGSDSSLLRAEGFRPRMPVVFAYLRAAQVIHPLRQQRISCTACGAFIPPQAVIHTLRSCVIH